MQVFNSKTQTFSHRDKYFGRALNPETFKDALVEFLHNGQELVTWFIPTMIKKLSKLVQVILSVSNFRFYGSSLLIVYDGHENADFMRAVDLRMIDFANTVKIAEENEHCEPDAGYLLGTSSFSEKTLLIIQTQG